VALSFPALKQLRIIIIAFIAVAAGAFIWLSLHNDPGILLSERLAGSDRGLVPVILLLAAFTLLSTLTGLPVFYISLSMGFLLDLVPALLICWGVNIVAVMAAFYMVRFAFSGYFRGKYGGKKLIRRINKRIGRYGMWPVVFSRAIYILPTSLINFSFPLSSITTRTYLAGTILGLVPECLVNVISGYALRHEVFLLSSAETRNWQALAIGGFILLFTGIFVALRLRQRRRKKFSTLKAIPYKG
jgi:uncharacterized membrane protein YdjX (TVP38/TMEM64 family)